MQNSKTPIILFCLVLTALITFIIVLAIVAVILILHSDAFNEFMTREYTPTTSSSEGLYKAEKFNVPGRFGVVVSQRQADNMNDEYKQFNADLAEAQQNGAMDEAFERALNARRIIESSPDNHHVLQEALGDLCLSYVEKRADTLAWYTCLKSLSHNAYYTPAYLYMGQMYLNTDMPDIAKQMFEDALYTDKQNADAHYGLGKVFVKQGNCSKAQSYFLTADRLNTTGHPYSYDTLLEKCR